MDIKQINNALTPRQTDNLRRSDSTRSEMAGRGEAVSTGQERVSINSLSAQATSLQEKAMQSEPDNRAKIERLKQAISDGTYEVDTQSVAKKLMQTEALFSTL